MAVIVHRQDKPDNNSAKARRITPDVVQGDHYLTAQRGDWCCSDLAETFSDSRRRASK